MTTIEQMNDLLEKAILDRKFIDDNPDSFEAMARYVDRIRELEKMLKNDVARAYIETNII